MSAGVKLRAHLKSRDGCALGKTINSPPFMSSEAQHHALSARRERASSLTLGAVQSTHILDCMILMPPGAQLMRVFNITPAQFTHLVATAGLIITVAPNGRLAGMPMLGYVTVTFFLLAAALRSAATHVSTPAAKSRMSAVAAEAAA